MFSWYIKKPHHHYLRKNMMALTANMKKPSLKVFSIVLLLSLSAFLYSIYSTYFSLANYTNYWVSNSSIVIICNSKPYPNDFLQKIMAIYRQEKQISIKVPKSLGLLVNLEPYSYPYSLQLQYTLRVFDALVFMRGPLLSTQWARLSGRRSKEQTELPAQNHSCQILVIFS